MSSAAIAADCLQKDNLNILENRSAPNVFAQLTRVHVWNINILNMKYEPYKKNLHNMYKHNESLEHNIYTFSPKKPQLFQCI